MHGRKKGILFLADVVDYTTQSVELGADDTRQINEKFESNIKEMANRHNGSFIKRIGDAALLFFEDETDFLNFSVQLREASLKRELDCGKFICDLRMVAHFARFSFEEIDEKISDLIGPEGIEVFRMEKKAGKHEVFITAQLLDLIEEDLKEKGIDFKKIQEKILKGFKRKTIIYRLIFPVKGEKKSPDALTEKMEELERETRIIHVFGDIYPAMSMGKNFVNLDLKSVAEMLAEESDFQYYEMDAEKERIDTIELKRDKDVYKTNLPLDVGDLYNKFNKGAIFGLPGSGKTTILKYFAFKEFKKNREITGDDNRRMVLFIACRKIMSYTEWFEKNLSRKQKDAQDAYYDYNIETILDYLLYCFLFNDEVPEENTALEKAGIAVRRAYYNGFLTILIDGLDEAPKKGIKEKITWIVGQLFSDSKSGKKKGNRIYLTSRYSEKGFSISGKEFEMLNPIFEVRSLDMEQLREMASYFYRDKPKLYKEFDDIVWKEEIAAKVGGTPLTALLVIAYFETFKKFDTRYYMYQVIVLFILIRAWKEIKEGYFKKDMKTFFKDAKSQKVLMEEQYKEAGEIFNALTLLSYGYIGKGKVITEEDIRGVFKMFTRDTDADANADIESRIELEVEKWLNRLREDHFLVPVETSEYVFIHATVMEYLTGRFLVEKLMNPRFLEDKFEHKDFEKLFDKCKPDFFETEIIPIAVGSGIKTGSEILRLLKKCLENAKNDKTRRILYQTALRCLAEFESFIDRKYRREKLEFLHTEMEKEIRENHDAVDWIYTYLKDLMLTNDKTRLRESTEAFQNISKLSRTILLDNYLTTDVLSSGNSELIKLKKEFLYKIVDNRLVDQWLKDEEEKALKVETLQNLMTLDSDIHHLEDKNFSYYQNYIGKSLVGFLGSPNLKHSSKVTCVLLSPSGKHIISSSIDNTIKIWDIEKGKEILTLNGHHGHHQPVTSIDVSADGRYLISGSVDNAIRLLALKKGEENYTFKGHKDWITSVCVSPDGKYFASGSVDSTIKLWDASNRKEIRTLKGHSRMVNSVCFSANAKYVISGSSDNTIILWDLEKGKDILTLEGHSKPVTCVDMTKDGKYIISGSSDNTIKLWDIEKGKEVRTFEGHKQWITSVRISPGGENIISGSADNTIKLWDLKNGKEIRTFTGHSEPINSVIFNADGKQIISGSFDHSVKLWDVNEGKEILTFKGHDNRVNSIDVSTDGKHIISASYDGTIKLWDPVKGKEIHTFKGHGNRVNSIGFSSDGKHIVSGSFDNSIKIWDIKERKEIRMFKGHIGSVNSVIISAYGKHIISGSDDATVKLWDFNNGKEIRSFKGHSEWVTCVAADRDGKHIISASVDKTLKLWKIGEKKAALTFKGHYGPINRVIFSTNGKYIISGSNDSTIKLWDANSGKELHTFKSHKGTVTCIGITADGNHLISGSDDYTLKLWDLEKKKCIRTINLLWIPFDIKQIPGKPYFFATANGNGTVTFFDFGDMKL
jgi:WD40 repeat protein/class 3 adenylate cyclase/GTPase SAR1 family protein